MQWGWEPLVDVEVSKADTDHIVALFTRAIERTRSSLRGVVAGMANYSAYWLRLYVPYYSGYTVRHVHASSATWRPGGFGGGGEWEATAGVLRGTSMHPLYEVKGTGIYGDMKAYIVPKGYRRPAAGSLRGMSNWGFDRVYGNGRRRLLTFQKRGEPRRFRPWVRGQRPRTFLYASFEQTKLYAQARVLTIGPEIFRD